MFPLPGPFSCHTADRTGVSEMGTSGDTDDTSLPQLSILDDATQKLLESDDDESRVLERYDTGDPQFMSRAYDDMRQLDCLLQERFFSENGQRRKRKRHLQKLHQTLSEFQTTDHARQEVGREAENTRRFSSATAFQYQAIQHSLGAETLDDISVHDGLSSSVRGRDTPETTFQSCGSSLYLPKRINMEELGDGENRWALVPFIDPEQDLQSFCEDASNFQDTWQTNRQTDR